MKSIPLVLLSAFAFVFAQGVLQSPPGSILPVNQTVLNGTSVTFECKFPNVTHVLWKFKGSILQHHMYGSDVHTAYKLIFPEVNYRLNVGPYQCVHYNNSSVKIYESPMVYLDIQYMERDFQQEPAWTIAVTGDTVTFNCVGPDSYPPITDVFWYKILGNGTVVKLSDSSRIQPNGTELHLMDVVRADGASYYCNVTNGVFWRKSENGHLSVNPLVPRVELVNVTASEKKIYVLPGDSALLECTVYFTSNLNEILTSSFVWTYNGNQITANRRRYVYPNGSLLLSDAREGIDGNYICTGRLNNWEDSGEASDTIHVVIAKIPDPPTVDAADIIGRDRDVNFTCNPPTGAEPPPALSWSRNGIELTSVSGEASQSGLNLSLKSLKLSDEGNYTCQAENLAGRKSSIVWLTVEDYPNISVTTEPVREGGEAKLTCTSTSARANEFTWSHGGSQINTSEKYLFSEKGEILTIRNISSADLGQYNCTVHDTIHVPRSGVADLTFTDKLYLKRPPMNVTELVNETVTFTCEFRYHSNDDWSVVWFHGNPELTPNSRISFSNKTNGDRSLTIRKISVKDHGMYTCKAVPNNTRTNMGMDEVIGSFFLIAVVPISFEKMPPDEVVVNVGKKLQIDCKAHGHPPPGIEWKSVNSHTGNYVDLKNGSLVFPSAKLNDSGQYTCTVFSAVNNGLALTHNTKVVVKEPDQGGINLPRDTIVIIVVGLIAILLYLVVFIICLCVCAQCYRNSLKKKKLELVAMEADMMRTNRKLSEAKDNSAILREVGTPMLSTGPVHLPSNMYTIPQTPSPPHTRRMETSFVDGLTSYTTGIHSPLPPVPTVVSDGTELPNFSRGNLKLGDRLGEGEFGPVLLGQAFGLTSNNMPVDVAIKVWLHPRDEDEETADNDLMNFYNQMRLQFDNIASIVGMCTDVEPYYIIYEYLDRGDLKQFLLECRPDEMDVPPLTQENLLHITKQVASGMAYLSSQLIIHGDLAARNCLISSDLRVKVADLGIGHDVYRVDYYDNGEQLLPVRWMPPEILNVPEFTLHSDIWSFGVFCWEVFAFGRLPYDDITDEEVLRLVPQGLRPEVPEEGCPLALYSLMRDCWSPQPEARPKFTQLVVAIIDLNLD